MKILLVSPIPPPYGGIANWTVMMLDYVKSTEDVIDTVNIAPKKRSTEGRTLFDRVVVSGFDMLSKRRLLKKKILESKPDVIHMTTSGQLAIFRDILLLKTARKLGVPTVYHIRFGRTAEMVENGSKMWRFFKKAMGLASAVMAIDEKTYGAIKKYVPEANVFCVPNPIDTKKLPPLCENVKKQVVFVGWVIETKGVSELVQAWNTVGEKYPDYNLIVVGQASADYLEKLKSQAKVGNIEFAGEMPHDKALDAVNESEVFILPSYTEGFPNAVLEAMALKKCVVATDVGAIPEILDGECGILIKPRSVTEIETALEKVLNDKELRECTSENAQNKVCMRYELKSVYARYKEIWDSVKE
ncbi:MAG: glycosyltransferase family 4 protein [Clostridia bacterium]|nr:glycosyltransferase family 4 protein [Clostridia bacterium]